MREEEIPDLRTNPRTSARMDIRMSIRIVESIER